jgi:ribosomal protein L12E/L44/L45/RPP1/RPP2
MSTAAAEDEIRRLEQLLDKEHQLRLDTQRALSEALNASTSNTRIVRAAREVLSADAATFIKRVLDYSKVIGKFAQDLLDMHDAFCQQDEQQLVKRRKVDPPPPPATAAAAAVEEEEKEEKEEEVVEFVSPFVRYCRMFNVYGVCGVVECEYLHSCSVCSSSAHPSSMCSSSSSEPIEQLEEEKDKEKEKEEEYCEPYNMIGVCPRPVCAFLHACSKCSSPQHGAHKCTH